VAIMMTSLGSGPVPVGVARPGAASEPMRFGELKFLLRCDLYRYEGRQGLSALLRTFRGNPGFQYTFWMRVCRYLRSSPARYPLFVFARIMLDRCKYRFGIDIPFTTRIGEGLYIGHFGGIVVNELSVIGKNCNLSHEVTLGQTNRGKRKGCPVIGDNVYIGPGAKLIGNVTLGSNVAVGTNCVVTHDVPENGVVVGVPGKVISRQGSTDYVNRTLT
jgi:serine O-acetyltransferase